MTLCVVEIVAEDVLTGKVVFFVNWDVVLAGVVTLVAVSTI